ncbi:MAG TPA: NAD(P)H-dependent oxidoreductase subunit E [Brevefilum fermentans]|jgi:NADH-quinone oxidoreductase subunit E|uniref:NAD(P)H-dependent oxidoreductase subunit n=1 Tax=Candidatus Brevifilum fermentans TaxID=1986204 RepID=A0A1Y6K3P9_9CHLR|nr:NAD(P)H-dependent oxidoreductase subunit E [Brevefilum fermentans]MDI9566974.1 NAD(P)H-dependent oxidoreductase subunit E [Chloroflexota bacterium]SMX54283.1 NAD(P)H-dependent oxidoreductase subunit [Brevefilum fermentans]HQA29149.1 NAD(P)H-dependent oxidoreductase subunit E [Brevefilum fermentans]
MPKTINKIPAGDPLNIPEQKEIIDRILQENEGAVGATMVVLNELQSEIGFISQAMQAYVAEKLGEPISRIHGVVSFYSFFTTTPRGKHTVKFCVGTACYVSGINQIIDKAKQILNIEPGETTEDGLITLELCRCVGACSQAPVVVVDDNIHGRVQPNRFPRILQDIIKSETE